MCVGGGGGVAAVFMGGGGWGVGGVGGKLESVLFMKHYNTFLRHWNTISFVEEMAIRILC